MDIVGTLKTSEIARRGLKIVSAKDYEGKEIIQLDNGQWYYHQKDLIYADVNGGPIMALINQLKDKNK